MDAEDQDNSDVALMMVQKLFTDQKINADQRDALKDMIFEEDCILLQLFDKYPDPEDAEYLQDEVIKYASKGNFGGKTPIEE